MLLNLKPFPKQALVFICLQYKSLKTLWEKEKRAISPFPTLFSTLLNDFLPFSLTLELSSAKSLSLEDSKMIGERVKVTVLIHQPLEGPFLILFYKIY